MIVVNIVVYVYFHICQFPLIMMLYFHNYVLICFGQGYPSYLSGSVECSHLPSAVASQIHERHSNYQRGDTQSELIRSNYCNVN